ncbi:hypothetical protein FGIG_11683 [Fasciola gigantica]|uniref:Uncharacterized protein n=1 Tax=Fasciola gigantica TaxID=46835 RepID=A0A504YLU6_FASGI|nr:hypothetical protein FGIG_11683 [Fasciola gigantica]
MVLQTKFVPDFRLEVADTMIAEQLQDEDTPLLLIGAGVGRTGTMALKTALEILYQLPCYHMTEMEQGLNDNLPEDVTPNTYSQKSTHMDSKYTRNPWTKVAHFWKPFFTALREMIFIAPGFGRMTDQSMRLALGGNVDLTDDDQMIRGFVHRIEEVKRVVPAERLLAFEVKDGWEPLCRFLNKTIPNVPFPSVNDRKEMQNRLKSMKMRANTFLFVSAVSVGLIAVVGAILFVSRV